MRLEDIGFYTLSDDRAFNTSASSPMWRCELILTDRCNFHCVYCRGLRQEYVGDMPREEAQRVLDLWIADGLRNVRFSGGEPMLYHGLEGLVRQAQLGGVEHIALSTNGSFPLELYERLVAVGIDDFSISLDACCAADISKMSGGYGDAFGTITDNIMALAKLVYVTIGIVLTKDNVGQLRETVLFAHDLGVADIRIIPAAQWNELLVTALDIPQVILDCHPILAYRVQNIRTGRNARGLQPTDSSRCYLVMDDSCVVAGLHFPCVIYLREGGNPIGTVGLQMRAERVKWSLKHNCYEDKICRQNCLDVCIDYNNKCRTYNQ